MCMHVWRIRRSTSNPPSKFLPSSSDIRTMNLQTSSVYACLTNSVWRSPSNPKCHVTASKTTIECESTSTFFLLLKLCHRSQCHNVTCLVVCVIPICNVSIDVWFFYFTSCTTCRILNCVCQFNMCVFFVGCKFLRVKCQKLAKALSKLHIVSEDAFLVSKLLFLFIRSLTHKAPALLSKHTYMRKRTSAHVCDDTTWQVCNTCPFMWIGDA